MNLDSFDSLVAFLEGVYGKDMTPKQRDAYWLLLREEPPAPVMARAIAYARGPQARYGFPKPGDLLVHEDAASKALLAWHTLLRAVDEHGAYQSVIFEDPTMSAVVQAMGGWLKVCDWRMRNETEERFLERDFERLYVTLMERKAIGPERHVGLIESHNADRWKHHTPEAVRIGTPGIPAPEPRQLPGIPEQDS